MRELERRGTAGALALLLDMAIERAPESWGSAITWVLGLAMARITRHMPGSLGLWTEAGLLSTTLGMRQLMGAGSQGAGETAAQDNATDSASAAIAALADGANNQVVAPLCWYLLGGLPGAMLYRLASQLPANLGPQGEQVVGWLRAIPAKVTGALFVAAALASRQTDLPAGRLWRQTNLTGQNAQGREPRMALANALGVQLDEAVEGESGAAGHPATRQDVVRARRLVRTAIALGAALTLSIPMVGRLRNK